MKIEQAQINFEALLINSLAGQSSIESKIMKVLAVLVENPNAVIRRETIIDKVWGVEHGGDESLSRAISILRKALGDTRRPYTYIETIPRRGYRLIAKLDSKTDIQFPPIANTEKLPADIKHQVEITPKSISLTGSKTVSKEKGFFFKIKLFSASGVVLATALWIGFAIYPTQSISRGDRIKIGLDHVKNFTLDEAIPDAQTLFSDILLDDPNHAAAQAGMALALIRQYTYIERDPALLLRAKSTAEMSIRSAPQLAVSNVAYGWTVEYEGDFAEALKTYDKVDILDPKNIFALEGRIRIYQKSNQREKAHTAIDQAISLYPNYSLLYSYLGYQWSIEGENAHAEAAYRHAIKLTNDNPRLYAQLASSLHKQGQTIEAIQVIQNGLKVRETGALYNNLGNYLFGQGQYEMAAEAFEGALQKGNSHDYLFWANLGMANLYIPSRKSEANTALDRAIQLLQDRIDQGDMKNPVMYNRLAYYNAQRGQFDLARKAMERVHFTDPIPTYELFRTCTIYELIGDRDQALIMLERAIKAGYRLNDILSAPELAELRQDPRYHRLLTTLNIDTGRSK